MKDYLKRLLDPADDGRAFTEAVLLKASGALNRRRQAAEAARAQLPAWQWLAQWARPWVMVTLVALAVLSFGSRMPWAPVQQAQGAPADSDVMAAAMLPADLAVATATEVLQER